MNDNLVITDSANQVHQCPGLSVPGIAEDISLDQTRSLPQ